MSQQKKGRELLEGAQKVRDKFESLEEIMQEFIDHCHTLSKSDFIPPMIPRVLYRVLNRSWRPKRLRWMGYCRSTKRPSYKLRRFLPMQQPHRWLPLLL